MMELKEVKLTFKCDIATWHQQEVKDLDLLKAISEAVTKELNLLGLAGNQTLKLEGHTG
jgi:hypothetical protein